MDLKLNTDFHEKWEALEKKFVIRFNKVPKLEAILFLIGLGEYNGIKESFSKEEKQNLIHIGLCRVLSYSGYYSLSHIDHEGWPHFESEGNMVFMELEEQEDLIKQHVMNYFEQNEFI
jgi:hypothetical protein